MQALINWGFRNKAAMGLLVVITLIIGIISYFRLPMEFLPEADNPQVTVVTLAQGYDAGSMTTNITEPVEQAVTSISGKTSILSTTGEGYSQVTLNFDSKTDMKEAKNKVEDAIKGIRLPEGVGEPLISQLNTSMIPIGQVSVTFDDGLTKENIDLANDEFRPLFEEQSGLSQVTFAGENSPRVQINLDHDKLEKLQIPVNAVMGVLQGQDVTTSAGSTTIDGQKSTINVTDNLTSVDALKNLSVPMQVPNAPEVKLKDIATVEKVKPEDIITRVNGKEALAVVLFKESDASAVTAGDQVTETVDKINSDYEGVEATALFTTGEMVENSVNSMVREVALGALFATLVILLFLRKFKPTLVTAVSIPLSLCITLFLLWLSGVTLNILTLGGVAVAVGRLVDDSIVVVENIFRRSQNEKITKQNVLQSTMEVSRAITSSTLITVAVFLPMGLVNGSLKAFLLPFGLTVTYSLLASLLVALTVVPLLSRGMLKNTSMPSHRPPHRYVNVLRWSLNHKFVPILLAILVFGGSIALYITLPKAATNANDASFVAVTMEFPSDTPADTVKQRMTDFEEKISSFEGYDHLITQYGSSEENAQYGAVSDSDTVFYTVIMKEDGNAESFIDQVNEAKKEEKDVTITASPSSIFGGSSNSSITYDVVGNDTDELLTTSKTLMDKISEVDGVKKVSSNQEKTSPVFTVNVNTEKANAQQTAMQIRSLLNPQPIGAINLDDAPTPVYLDAGVNPDTLSDLKDLTIATSSGIQPLTDVASITEEEKPSTVLHKDGDLYVRITAEVEPEKLSVISKNIATEIKDIDLPKGVSLDTGGAAAQQADDFKDLGMTMLASILIVYLIMVLTFKTLKAPLAILITLPLASIGAVLGLLIARVPADATALIGALMLIGIVVTNAIVLIDRVKQNEETMIIRDAIIEACGTRLRPVVMTAVATICAMLPLLFGHTEDGSLVSKSLAVVVIGGLAGATVLTLVVVPVFYELLYFRKSKRQRTQQLEGEEKIAQ
ncbi:efflux RND transporter permease subunit [Rossellomorea aquimaris]|jgi:multidrug efflux pump subunit AcrB|uniref:Multidrug transporter AcrB n=1 Tax=Rossellomorea aquimaris TaxID=189382 RepID=A0A1J6W0M5_9BACI|nr:efflux RND transporter permease subunit [Rossellomorea aquimaris]OIU71670.1 multidrug transporter AcrB [Rossellomorea aquimaris]